MARRGKENTQGYEKGTAMTCKIKEFLNKRDTECTTPKCEMCWYKEKFEDLALESMESDRKENQEEWE